jgi:hypothetical protein
LEDELSYSREGLSATVLDDSIFFSGGRLYDTVFSTTIDIYDVSEDEWSTHTPSSPGRWMTSAVSGGGKVFIAGGLKYPGGTSYSEIDVYDKETGEWSVEYLSISRYFMSAIAYGNKIFFAGGGSYEPATIYDIVDIYDLATGTWDTNYLILPRWGIGAAAAGDKVFFAGGCWYPNEVTNFIDVYNINTGEWSLIFLEEERAIISAVAYSDRVYFAGGAKPFNETSYIIEVYNVSTEEWEEPMYFEELRIVKAMKVKDALVFVGEASYINLSTGAWGPSNGVVDVYYPETGEWEYNITSMEPSRDWYGYAAYDNKAYIGGGTDGWDKSDNLVSILEYDYQTGLLNGVEQDEKFLIYPNPCSSSLTIRCKFNQKKILLIKIYNQQGILVKELDNIHLPIDNQSITIDVENLKKGIYYCVLKTTQRIDTKKIIKLN